MNNQKKKFPYFSSLILLIYIGIHLSGLISYKGKTNGWIIFSWSFIIFLTIGYINFLINYFTYKDKLLSEKDIYIQKIIEKRAVDKEKSLNKLKNIFRREDIFFLLIMFVIVMFVIIYKMV